MSSEHHTNRKKGRSSHNITYKQYYFNMHIIVYSGQNRDISSLQRLSELHQDSLPPWRHMHEVTLSWSHVCLLFFMSYCSIYKAVSLICRISWGTQYLLQRVMSFHQIFFTIFTSLGTVCIVCGNNTSTRLLLTLKITYKVAVVEAFYSWLYAGTESALLWTANLY